MKKLLSVLGTMTLIGTVNINILACKTPNSENIKEQYKINEQGEIIYNFQVKQAYIIGLTINNHIYESNIYVNNIPLKTTIYGQGTQY